MPGFTIIDNELIDNQDLSIQEQSLLIALIRYYSKEKGYSYPSYPRLKKAAKIGDNRTFSKSINSLIEKGYISKETKLGIGNKYYILKYASLPSGELHQVENYTQCKNTPPPSGELHHDPVENYTTTNTNTNTNTKIYIDDFEELWKLYPNKKGKAKSRQVVTKLLKKYSKEELERCIDRYSREMQGKDKQYILHGSTFFNGRYEDYLDNNYQDQQTNELEDKKTQETYAELEHLKGGIEFEY